MSEIRRAALYILDSCQAEDGKELMDELFIYFDALGLTEPVVAPVLDRAHYCKRGHKFTPDNTYYTPSTGWRHCRICIGIRNSKRVIPKKPCQFCGGEKDTGARAKLCSFCRELPRRARVRGGQEFYG